MSGFDYRILIAVAGNMLIIDKGHIIMNLENPKLKDFVFTTLDLNYVDRYSRSPNYPCCKTFVKVYRNFYSKIQLLLANSNIWECTLEMRRFNINITAIC